MTQVQLNRKFDPSIYNSLSSVEEANNAVMAGDRIQDFLTDASELFFTHGMEERLGIGLLHRHFQCDDVEHMVEYQVNVDGEEALVTKPVSITDLEPAVPTIWSNSSTGFQPLEYSTDPLAVRLFWENEIPEDFLTKFSSLKTSSPIGEHLGLAIVHREFYKHAPADAMPLEYSSPSDRSSIVLIRDRAIWNEAIVTAWGFRRSIDPVLKCVDIQECLKRCHPATDNKHTITHRPGPPEHLISGGLGKSSADFRDGN